MILLFFDLGIFGNWIIDHIPIWVWVVMILAFTGGMFYLFSPVLVPLWNLTPRPIKIAGGVILSIILAALAGRYKGTKDAEELQRKREAEAMQKRKEVDDAVNKLAPGEAEKRLRDRWSRD